MDVANIPDKFPVAWASAAGGAYVRDIPDTSQIGVNAGFASLPDGFVPLNATPTGAGGVPPFIQDFNGIFRAVTSWNRWQQAGGPITYDAAFQTDVGGYPQGAVVQSATTPGRYWRSTTDSNITNPDTGGAGWVNLFSPVFVAASFTGGMGVAGGLTVSSGGAAITGNSSLIGTMSISGLASLNGGFAAPGGGWDGVSGRITGAGFTSNANVFLVGTNATITAENASGAAFQCCYSGVNPLVAAASSRLQSTAPVLYGFFYGAANVGNITTNGSSTTYGTTSDRRLKDITGPLEGAADRLLKVQVHRFTWKANPDAGEVDGFIADELQSVIPEAVTGQPDQEADVGDLYMTAGTILTRGLEEEPAELDVDCEYVAKTGNVRLMFERVLATDQPKHPASELGEGVHWRKTGTVPIYQNVDQSKVVPLLVAALQEALGRIAALEAAQGGR